MGFLCQKKMDIMLVKNIKKGVMKLSPKKRFFKFLKDEEIWHLYWENVRIGQNNKWPENKIREKASYISDAFLWEDSISHNRIGEDQDGYSFWSAYNAKWHKLIDRESL